MPNYLANRAFANITDMTSFLLDDTDEDMLGPFILPTNANDYRLVVWRRYSTKAVDNETVYPANGPGRWVILPSGGGGGGTVVIQPVTGDEYWNRAKDFAQINEWLVNSKDYSLQNWLSSIPGNFVEGSNS